MRTVPLCLLFLFSSVPTVPLFLCTSCSSVALCLLFLCAYCSSVSTVPLFLCIIVICIIMTSVRSSYTSHNPFELSEKSFYLKPYPFERFDKPLKRSLSIRFKILPSRSNDFLNHSNAFENCFYALGNPFDFFSLTVRTIWGIV